MTAPDTLPPELAELGELLREDPPRPDRGWASGLDARAAAGFPRPSRPSPWARLKGLRPVLLPAMGVATALLVVVALASMDLSSDEGQGGGGGASMAQTEQSEPAPSGGAGEASSGGGGELRSQARPNPSSGSADDAGTSIAPTPAVPPPTGGGSPRSDGRDARKQERSAALTLATERRQIERVGDGIVRVTDAAGGFVASSNVSGGAAAGGSFELRIPANRLQRTLAELSRLAHVRERSQASRDITAESVTARERLRESRREREGLLRALARAVTLNETQSIKARLRSVNASIASARASVRRVDNRAAYANVSVSLVAQDAGFAAPGDDGRWTPGDAFGDAVRVLEVAAGIALIVLAIALPLALLAGLAVAASRVAGRRRRERALDIA
jgi:hypothetical protein